MSSSNRSNRTVLAGLVLSLLVASGCAERDAGPEACREAEISTKRLRNVVVVLGDTIQRDRASTYGGPARTPNLTRLSERGLRFDAAVSQAPWTKPAIGTLFTGTHPWEHGLMTHPRTHMKAGEKIGRRVLSSDVLAPEFTTMAETFRRAGFRTAAFVANPWLDHRFGLAQGFEIYDDSFAQWSVPGAPISAAAVRWLDGLAETDRFFLYVHYLDPHRPYTYLSRARLLEHLEAINADERPLTDEARDAILQIVQIRDWPNWSREGVRPTRTLLELAYDAGIEKFDLELGRLMDSLARIGADRDTLIVAMSDHGEALYERGYANHGRGLYEDELGIPLVVAGPGTPTRAIDCAVGLIDVLPALCDVFSLACPAEAHGRAFLSGGSTEGTARFEVSSGVAIRPRNRAVRDGRFKLLFEPDGSAAGGTGDVPWSLYDLASDPGEENDLVGSAEPTGAHRATFDELRAALETVEATSRTRGHGESAPLSPDLVERLEELGYFE